MWSFLRIERYIFILWCNLYMTCPAPLGFAVQFALKRTGALTMPPMPCVAFKDVRALGTRHAIQLLFGPWTSRGRCPMNFIAYHLRISVSVVNLVFVPTLGSLACLVLLVFDVPTMFSCSLDPKSCRKVNKGSLFRAVDPFSAFTMTACQLNPTSRGEVAVVSPDPLSAPVIDPNYLHTAEDRVGPHCTSIPLTPIHWILASDIFVLFH